MLDHYAEQLNDLRLGLEAGILGLIPIISLTGPNLRLR